MILACFDLLERIMHVSQHYFKCEQGEDDEMVKATNPIKYRAFGCLDCLEDERAYRAPTISLNTIN